jgi:hypothetical protein
MDDDNSDNSNWGSPRALWGDSPTTTPRKRKIEEYSDLNDQLETPCKRINDKCKHDVQVVDDDLENTVDSEMNAFQTVQRRHRRRQQPKTANSDTFERYQYPVIMEDLGTGTIKYFNHALDANSLWVSTLGGQLSGQRKIGRGNNRWVLACSSKNQQAEIAKVTQLVIKTIKQSTSNAGSHNPKRRESLARYLKKYRMTASGQSSLTVRTSRYSQPLGSKSVMVRLAK